VLPLGWIVGTTNADREVPLLGIPRGRAWTFVFRDGNTWQTIRVPELLTDGIRRRDLRLGEEPFEPGDKVKVQVIEDVINWRCGRRCCIEWGMQRSTAQVDAIVAAMHRLNYPR
jgi:hypothetical protein